VAAGFGPWAPEPHQLEQRAVILHVQEHVPVSVSREMFGPTAQIRAARRDLAGRGVDRRQALTAAVRAEYAFRRGIVDAAPLPIRKATNSVVRLSADEQHAQGPFGLRPMDLRLLRATSRDEPAALSTPPRVRKV
jgi:hypothetical protein